MYKYLTASSYTIERAILFGAMSHHHRAHMCRHIRKRVRYSMSFRSAAPVLYQNAAALFLVTGVWGMNVRKMLHNKNTLNYYPPVCRVIIDLHCRCVGCVTVLIFMYLYLGSDAQCWRDPIKLDLLTGSGYSQVFM